MKLIQFGRDLNFANTIPIYFELNFRKNKYMTLLLNHSNFPINIIDEIFFTNIL